MSTQEDANESLEQKLTDTVNEYGEALKQAQNEITKLVEEEAIKATQQAIDNSAE